VRTAAGIGFPGVPVVEQFLLADVHAEWARDRSTSAGWFHRDGVLLAMPMRDPDGRADLWRLMADVPATGERLDTADIIARFERLLPQRAGEHGVRITGTVWTSVFRIHRRLADTYRQGRVVLAGDAAHVHSPIGGQGMNTGIGDAENLAWKLGLVVRARASPALLDTYTAERRPQAVGVLRRTTANTRLLVAEGGLARFVRDRVLVPLLGSPAVQRRATRVASQLGVTYRRGPLGGRGPAPRPGDRVPELPCARPDGAPAALHSELGPEWAVLAPAREGVAVDAFLAVASTHLGDGVVPLHADVPDVRLVRPDGHLAWRGTDPAGMERLLTAVLHEGRAV
jgi:4,5-epoxidase